MTTLKNLPSQLNESTNADGTWQEAWSPVLTALSHFDNTQITSCQHELHRRYRENGLAFGATVRRQAGHRPWNLDLMPQMMAGSDWQKLERGLQQRARLKSALLKDLYGEQSVLREGIIPAQAVFAHNGFIESAVGIPTFDSMPMYSADVSRSPSGDWYVADDICQAPNGIGYALENRLILSGVLSSLYRHTRVRRLAEYFKHMRNVLFQHVDSNARCVILGYGASHHYHFEQAYLSKYLGYTLVQINDLTVRGKHAWLKTVDGMQRVDVIFRFVDDIDIDPMAGDGTNTQGVPGLLHAAREGGVIVVNPIGAAAVENPAFNAWLPEICQFLLDEPIELLGTPTYWLGNVQHKLWVESHLKNLLIRDIDTRSELQDPALMSDDEISTLRFQISEASERFIAQERIGRSSTPTLINETIEPRQLTMRMYLMSKGDSYRIMPGGLGLLDMQVGGGRRNIRDMESSKDIWVVSDKSVPHDTLLDKKKNNAAFRIVDGELPSSVAESLFWLGRYAERVESSSRVLLGVCLHLRSDERFQDEDSAVASLAALLKSTTQVTGTLPGFIGNGARKRISDPNKELMSLLSEVEKTGSLPNTLESLSFSAATVRDRLSSDMLRVINSLDDHNDELQELQLQSSLLESNTLNSAIDKLNALLFSIAAFSGLTRENMTQGDGWRFLQIGKRIERASQTSVLLSTVFSEYRDNSYALEDLLSVLCSAMTYRSRYRTLIEPFLVLHLLVADETNPRSIGYQLKNLEAEIQLLPGRRKPDYQEPALRAATEGLARTRLIDPVNLLQQDSQSQEKLSVFLSAIKNVPGDIANAISAQYFTHTEAPNILYSGFDMSEPTTGKGL
jgi:uncharacterized circularly permuted ATP-grasp superfamily protein/uncharacterized alpha-E superfamily protein